ncbi:phytoene desaturase family protein [Robertkochia solimangrovi]|uniref:phytoene desaturase family protein n=1 Tax=Robertkochia solimangrovi TaxID=2213046 RepID=UPI00117FBCA2|nr:phytoene desaturase family protein [Robertkochia solimangrovi]TRZ42264.1 phytoene desaturase [Robertkochia solimangrovi]
MSKADTSVIIIGSGFSSLSAACYLAKAGYKVTVLEKQGTTGGRARQLHKDGFTFDMGPTFYWMPDVFESFFADFDKRPSDYYHLEKLNPAYRVFFGKDDYLDIADEFEKICETFEATEKGSSKKLNNFINKAKENYDIAIRDLVYKPGENLLELVTPKTISRLSGFITSIKKQVSGYVTDSRLRKILEFPVLFLGAKPENTPAFYNFMNYADLKLGTWHPLGGMYEVVKGIQELAESLGVFFYTHCDVQGFEFSGNKITAVKTSGGRFTADLILSGADYHFTETLLPSQYRQYSELYWDSRTFAPSALLFYVGFDKPVAEVTHHTLFFDSDFDLHARAIYDTKQWAEDPLFYASFPGKTDRSVVPEGKESGIFLIPIAPGIEDTEKLREKYFRIVMERLEKITGIQVSKHILFKESFCVNDFTKDYNAYKGNAYGLANTLMQTHILRPRLKSKKVDNLYFCGQLTLPGPGVPPALISGKIVSQLIRKYHKL